MELEKIKFNSYTHSLLNFDWFRTKAGIAEHFTIFHYEIQNWEKYSNGETVVLNLCKNTGLDINLLFKRHSTVELRLCTQFVSNVFERIGEMLINLLTFIIMFQIWDLLSNFLYDLIHKRDCDMLILFLKEEQVVIEELNEELDLYHWVHALAADPHSFL